MPRIEKKEKTVAGNKVASGSAPVPDNARVELDKFKRRLIRAVARLLYHERKEEKEIWCDLKKETGCDCKLLWTRMRALTLKKLDRLFAAEDRVEAIPKAARMSLTDWLLFDLVLVHQKIDLIGEENPSKDIKSDPTPLVDLFEIVKMYKIEGKSGDDLAEAWSEATRLYNSQGHQCSPMLLQRRWYQLKEVTRSKFYDFWFAYRGTAKRLSLAEPFTPSPLQAAIARKFKSLVTTPFLQWEELIQQRLVTLPEEFERKMIEQSSMMNQSSRVVQVDDGPDLEVIEPNIETIDLGPESDNENDNNSQEEGSPPPTTEVRIKEEPQDDIDIDETVVELPKKSMFEEVMESTCIENEKIDSMDMGPMDDVVEAEVNVPTEEEAVLPQITSVFGNVSDTSALSSVSAPDVSDSAKSDNVEHLSESSNHDKETVCNATDNVDSNTDSSDNDSSNIVETNSVDANNIVRETNINVSAIDAPEDTITDRSSHPVTISDSDEADVENTDVQEKNTNEAMDIDIKPKIDIAIPPIGIVDENAMTGEDSVKIEINPQLETFSFGELSNDISFADDGIEFADDGIAYHDEDSQIDTKDNIELIENDSDNTPSIDEKLLMFPIVYTTRLDDMGLFRSRPFDHVDDKHLLDDIALKSKPIKYVPVDHPPEDDEDDVIHESKKVKPTSYLLQKPRSRTYHPIQLCKNPDFNTRLKKLTVGFFSSPRNRALIKGCKPLTIDLSKAFESKLISGTLYLKPHDNTEEQKIVDDTDTKCHNVSVVPSALPAQSLIDNSSDILSSYKSQSKPEDSGSASERNKIINLPDISEIRRINQRLLTAEVTPIQVRNNMPQVPVTLIAKSSSDSVTAEKHMQTAEETKCPTNVVDMTKDSPTKRSVGNELLQERLIAPRAALNMSKFDALLTSVRGNGGRGRRKVLYPAKPLPWKPREIRPKIPWYKAQDGPSQNNKIHDTLLTLDTLNKMLYLLTDKDEQPSSAPKPKSKKKVASTPQPPRVQTERPVTDESADVQVIDRTENDITSENAPKRITPKINIKAATNYPPAPKDPIPKSTPAVVEVVTNISDENSSEPVQESTSRSADQSNDGKKSCIHYCCWSRQKMLQMVFSRKKIAEHPCEYPLCTCCCRSLLRQYIWNDHKLKNPEAETEICLDDFIWGKNIPRRAEKDSASADTTTPAEVPLETGAEIPASEIPASEIPVIDVEAAADDVDNLNTEGSVPAVGGEVSVTTTSPATPVTEPSRCRGINTPVSVSSGNTIMTFLKKQQSDLISCNLRPISKPSQTSEKNQSKSNVQTSVNLIDGNVNKDSAFSKPSITKILAKKKKIQRRLTTINTQPPQPSPQGLSIATPKAFKEKMIFLNSKLISEKPSENPIFLGKNKILLTTVKFPPNLKKFEEAKQALAASLYLPRGVQLVCQPDGVISFTKDPNVELTSSDLAEMPAIVAAVQSFINLKTAQEENLLKQMASSQVATTENEVVDLIDDDDDVIPIDTNISNETTPVTELETTEVDKIDKNIDAPNDTPHNGTEEKPMDDEILNNTQIETETENNKNETTDQNSITIENVPEPTHTPISADSSTMSVEQTQPETSSQGESIKAQEDGDKEEPVGESKSEIPTSSVEKDQHDSEVGESDAKDDTRPEPARENKSKNILSDLMQMSGISDQDVMPLPETTSDTAEQQIEQPYLYDSAQKPLLQTALEASLTQLSASMVTDSSSLQHINLHKLSNNVVPVVKSPLGELSPITSLYELKYACQNKGIFFKLDFETGYLVPINVCMKQHQKERPKPKTYGPKSVIDLTDDDDSVAVAPSEPSALSEQITPSEPSAPSEQSVPSAPSVDVTPNVPITSSEHITASVPVTSSEPQNQTRNPRSLLIPKTISTGRVISLIPCKPPILSAGSNHVKPIKLFKVLNRTDQELTQFENKSAHKLNRKQFIRKVDLRIDDQDVNDVNVGTPNTERPNQPFKRKKLKKRSSNTDTNTETSPTTSEEPAKTFETNIPSDDSSDEEPLANLAKRKKESDSAQAESNMIEMEPAPLPPAPEDVDMMDPEDEEPQSEYKLKELFPSNEDTDDENCILGV